MITVIDRLKAMGIEPEPRLSWEIGWIVRDLWEEEEGFLPTKGLRPKTKGPGSHCFALYPTSWSARIDEVIRKVTARRESVALRQPELPLGF